MSVSKLLHPNPVGAEGSPVCLIENFAGVGYRGHGADGLGVGRSRCTANWWCRAGEGGSSGSIARLHDGARAVAITATGSGFFSLVDHAADDLVGPPIVGRPIAMLGRNRLDDRFGLRGGQPHQGADELVFGFPRACDGVG